MPILLAIFLPLAAVPFLAAGTRLGRQIGWVALAVPLVSFALILSLGLRHEAFDRSILSWPWIPALGVELSFLVDGLSLFYGLIVSGMGVLVTFYSIFYLRQSEERHAAFHALMMLFMGSMLGTVFAENLLLLVVFWELTGVASFLLIGFEHEERESRAGARMALLVTAGTGLVMLAGVVLLALSGGTLSLARLLAEPPPGGREALGAAFVLIMVGAFGKSAQFPFHFWLPKAMAAPTPVSAYLHSAAMVKLGVFLTARMFPLFSDAAQWTPLLIGFGFLTMTLGAALALVSHDIKALLAYATVSQLGLLIGSYGLERHGVSHDLVHVAEHTLYKGCLFMVAGIVGHAAGTRDLRSLGGLWSRAPLLGAVCLIAAATLAGLPGTVGFPVKESTLKALYQYAGHGGPWPYYPLVLAAIASALNVAIGARLFWSTFGGAMPKEAKRHAHAPDLAIQMPPLLLAAACVVFGLWPAGFSALFEPLRVSGLHAAQPEPLRLWHGFTREFVTGLGIVAAGAALFAAGHRARWRHVGIPRGLRFDRGFEGALEHLGGFARGSVAAMRLDRPTAYFPITAVFVVGSLGTWLLLRAGPLGLTSLDWEGAGVPFAVRSIVVPLIAVAVAMAVRLRQWTGQLIALSVVGFLITLYYVLFHAPDLAMTQILIDSVTLMMVLLLLVRFSYVARTGESGDRPSAARRLFHAALSAAFGLTMAAVVYVGVARRPARTAGGTYLEVTEPLAHGRNAVNTILTDFRAMDTLFEITVVLVAALGALGLFMRYRRGRDEYAAGANAPGGFGIEEVRKEEGR